jgi:serine/threonine protein kinase
MIGTQLGHYRIARLLGTGGMGEVYLAGDPDRRERFEREARAAAALNHPNIVTIHSVEETRRRRVEPDLSGRVSLWHRAAADYLVFVDFPSSTTIIGPSPVPTSSLKE